MIPRKWEVWLVEMPFDDVPGAKIRPALVIDSQTQLVLVGKMTSHPPRSDFPYEYQMVDWQGAGLSVPTTLRLSRLVRLQPSSFRKRVGLVRTVDQANIRTILKEIAANMK